MRGGGGVGYNMAMSDDVIRYREMIRGLAERAIGLAVDASPHGPAEQEVVISLVEALPCARLQLGHSASMDRLYAMIRSLARAVDDGDDRRAGAGAGATLRVLDGRGHGRPVYRWLLLDQLLQTAAAEVRGNLGHDMLILELADTPWESGAGAAIDPPFVLWSALRSVRGGVDAASLREVWEGVIGEPGDGRPLHEQTADESPDEWTYRELTGLHALHHLAELTGHGPWRARVREITDYHQRHTQPDYTTYQPWALAAFLSNPETRWFAEQQLHDVETHLAVEGGAGAVVAGLLLADAWASLGGG